MTTLRDILLELRAIRFGLQMLLIRSGLDGNLVDLLKMAELDNSAYNNARAYQPKKPRDHTAILHRNDEAAAARELLEEMGDDTPKMLEYMREHFGEEAAEGMRQFHEKEIVGKRR